MNFSVILCRDYVNGGIGREGVLPWNIPFEMRHFKNTTTKNSSGNENVVVMGRKTFESLKEPLQNRINIVVSSSLQKDNVVVVSSLTDALNYCKKLSGDRYIFVIGGEKMYREAFSSEFLETIYLTRVVSLVNTEYDTYFNDKIPSHFKMVSSENYPTPDNNYNLVFEKWNRDVETCEVHYKNLLSKVLTYGEEKIDRTLVGTISLFGSQIEFDVSNYFPLLSIKRVPLRVVFEELIWFLRGQTDNKILNSKNVHIWDGNSSAEYMKIRGLDYPEGELGPIYGAQWRNFGGEHDISIKNHISTDSGGVDQVKAVIDELKNNPSSRRLVVSAWNPKDINKMALPPCFVKNTLVYTSSGYKYIQDISKNDSVLTHKNRFMSVLSIQKKEYDDDIYSVSTISNEIVCTKEHPFYAKENVDSLRKWVECQNLREGMFVSISIPQYNPIIFFTPVEMYIIGYFVNRGNLFYRRGIISLQKNKIIIEFLKSTGYNYRDKNTDSIEVCSVKLYDFLSSNYLDSVVKCSNIKYFIRGFEESVQKEHSLVECLHLQKIYLSQKIVKRIVKGQNRVYTLCNEEDFHIEDDMLWTKIKEISVKKYKDTVYNFEVEGDNSYSVNNIIVHNCHMLWQLYNRGEYVDCKITIRSNDLFLGAPFNIASYSLLLYMICHITGHKPGRLIYSIGDAHIYKNHVDAVREILSRPIRAFPKLEIVNRRDKIEDFEFSDFKLTEYNPHPVVKAQMAV